MAESILRFVNVGKFYGDNQVLKGINMDVRPGEIHALIGENGAGKSTLMNILFGMPVIHETGGFEGALTKRPSPRWPSRSRAAMAT